MTTAAPVCHWSRPGPGFDKWRPALGVEVRKWGSVRPAREAQHLELNAPRTRVCLHAAMTDVNHGGLKVKASAPAAAPLKERQLSPRPSSFSSHSGASAASRLMRLIAALSRKQSDGLHENMGRLS